MRVEPHGIGSVLHVVKRGARGMDIVQDADDRRHFVRSLFFLNDTYQDTNVATLIANSAPMVRPLYWPKGESLTEILAWTLMPNHLHFVLHETREGGIAKFMQRLGGSMSARNNAKRDEMGSLFQGGYKGRVIEDDSDLRWLAAYVMVKNVLELYPDGLHKAAKSFDKAWLWAQKYPYSSMSTYAAHTPSPIVNDSNILFSVVGSTQKFKRDAYDMIDAFVSRDITKREHEHTSIMLETN